jgi:hypothetical protein
MTMPICADCESEMEIGFIPDLSEVIAYQASWHRGQAKANQFLGLKTGTVKVDRTKFVPVTAYRCSGCRLLKLYANVPETK